MKKAIIIIGPICSGKTTLALAISEEYNIAVASFGSFLKEYCLKQNVYVSRRNLQDLGEKLVHENPNEFLMNVINFSSTESGILIFEGVRHKVIFDIISTIFPSSLSIFVNEPYSVRLMRYLARNKDTDYIKNEIEFEKANMHSVELEIQSLQKSCDITISSTENESLRSTLSAFLAI